MLRKSVCLLIVLFAAVAAEAGTFSATGSSSRSSSTTTSEPSVELYSTSWCGYCQKARTFFRERGISFVEYDIEKDRQAALRKQQLDSGRGVPFAVINGHKISGYSERLYLQALESSR